MEATAVASQYQSQYNISRVDVESDFSEFVDQKKHSVLENLKLYIFDKMLPSRSAGHLLY
jgi:hypothetical protein